jgi:predicted regulator of Ras-like GTPase activity (Roadblock/LC7/MglB family)
MNELDQLLHEIHLELGADLISTDVVGMDGLSIANISTSPDFNSSAASARFAMVVKLASKVAGKIEMGEVEDNLVTTDQAYILTRLLGDGSYYWGVAVTRDATLGIVRMLMNEYADLLWNAIPH